MPKYSVRHSVATAASATLFLACWQAIATTQLRRFKLIDIVLGFNTAPADNQQELLVARCTVAQVGAAATPTPSPFDAADAAACFQASTGTYATTTPTAGVTVLTFAMNQRNTIRWSAAPGEEVTASSTAGNGLGVLSNIISAGTPTLSIMAVIDE